MSNISEDVLWVPGWIVPVRDGVLAGRLGRAALQSRPEKYFRGAPVT
jgi:hypothetical protein